MKAGDRPSDAALCGETAKWASQPGQTTTRGSAKWQAERWPSSPSGRSISSGSSTVQISWAFQQRVWKRQAFGGLAGLGTSPVSTICSRVLRSVGSGTGTADSSAWVYGWVGRE